MKRPDGRRIDQTRDIEAKVGIIPNANGSAMFRIGNTVAIAGVYGPKEMHPRREEKPDRAVVKVVYDMYSFSVSERKRPGPDRRSNELCMVIRNALEPAIMTTNYPKCAIEIYVSIIQADAGTRCAAISAASLALADAGIAMRDMVAAVACGNILDTAVLDLNKEEEDIEGATDIPVAYMPRMKKFTLLQLDGKVKPERLKECLKLAVKGCEQIYELQKKVLKEKYSNNGAAIDES
jgi:exosome complex component RRP41